MGHPVEKKTIKSLEKLTIVRRKLLFISSTIMQSPKSKRVSFNETPEFPFWGVLRFVFDLRDLKNGKYEETKIK